VRCAYIHTAHRADVRSNAYHARLIMKNKKSIHQLGGEAVKKKYGNAHFVKLAKLSAKSRRKQKLKTDS
jgi:hypothetical protein